ncbi:PREDICTED: phosphatidylinositol phosphatase PTPRQ-like [Wasmannia auropunctata]|uniref:phosphatidylinositol phosphatase PTPRQ-like n=1 Tax=Wasmannia auropunctata TaxID=64793 RepID=UPI0005EF1245|nr:PREDICTED: phosphatidylinositol phosphatase PTPRQ-like [Wasmannia auropunctata]
MFSSNTQLTLIWKPPHKPNGKIVRYEVILKVKEYCGCRDLEISTPDNHIITTSTIEPRITIPDLHLYTFYSAQIIAHNSRHFSMNTETAFITAQSEIPSEVFTQLKIQDWKLSWSPPEDCTTILGSLKARIKIQDLDQLSPKLNGVERYLATVYVIRDFLSKENASAYQKYEFETPPTGTE